MSNTDDQDKQRRAMQQFLYAVSHDLQEPFRKVRTFGQRLAARLEGQMDEAARADLDRVLSAAERGHGMIEGLLILSRLETHGGTPTEVDLNETLVKVCEELQEKIASTSAVVTVEPLPSLQADAQQMKLLFASLVDNAIKFQGAEKPPHVGVFSVDSQDASKVRIIVEDNGIGLEQQYVDRIFTVFQRLHPRDVYPGLGLGLTYSQKIVERHGGTIQYEPSPAGGTRFVVTIPVSPQPS